MNGDANVDKNINPDVNFNHRRNFNLFIGYKSLPLRDEKKLKCYPDIFSWAYVQNRI